MADERGRYKRAIKYYSRALRLHPNDTLTYFLRAIEYVRLSKFEKALADYDKGISLDTTFPVAYFNRALLHDQMKRPDLSMADANKAIHFDSTYASAYSQRGMLFHKSGNYEKAESELVRAIGYWNITDNDSMDLYLFYYSLGLVYYEKEEYPKAIDSFTTSIDLGNKDKDVYLDRADAYSALNLNELAEKDRKKAKSLKRTPDFINRW